MKIDIANSIVASSLLLLEDTQPDFWAEIVVKELLTAAENQRYIKFIKQARYKLLNYQPKQKGKAGKLNIKITL